MSLYRTAIVYFLLNIIYLSGYGQDFLWTKNNGTDSEDVQGRNIAIDSNGNIFLVGPLNGSIIINGQTYKSAGQMDILLIKYDSLGNVIWCRTAGGLQDDFSPSLATDKYGNIFITGYFRGTAKFDIITLIGQEEQDFFIAKYNSQGDIQWAKSALGPNDQIGNGITIDSIGNAYVTGAFMNSIDFPKSKITGNSNYSDIFMAKFDSLGNNIWAQKAGGIYGDNGQAITSDNDGYIYITGFFSATSYFGNIQISASTPPMYDTADEDIFIAKYDTSGFPIWVKSAGGASPDYSQAIKTDHQKNVIITGFVHPDANFSGQVLTGNSLYGKYYIAKYDQNGELSWVKSGIGLIYGGNSLGIDNTGNIYTISNYLSKVQFDNIELKSKGGWDIYVVKYDPDGKVLWAKTAGGVGQDYGYGLVTNSKNEVYISGFVMDKAIFGYDTITSPYNGIAQDLFLSKLGIDNRIIIYTSPDKTICEGNNTNIKITTKPLSSLSYKWQVNVAGEFIDLTDSDIYNNVNSDNLTLKNIPINLDQHHLRCIVLSEGIVIDTSNEIQIFVKQSSIVDAGNDLILCTGEDKIQLDGKIIGEESTGIWSTNGSGYFSPDNTTLDAFYYPSLSDNNIGTINFTLTSTNLKICSTTSDNLNITFDKCTILNESNNPNQINVYPNPATNKLSIQNSNLSEIIFFVIYNSLGLKVKSQIGKSGLNEINIEDLQNGIYYLIINTDNGESITKKIVKK